jgi:hypothetical protein
MFRKLILSTICVLAMATTSHAGLAYSWVKTGTALFTNNLALAGPYDTWEFQLWSLDTGPFGGVAKNYDALSLNFTSSTGAFLATGSTTFKSGPANPTVFGFTAPIASLCCQLVRSGWLQRKWIRPTCCSRTLPRKVASRWFRSAACQRRWPRSACQPARL